MDRIGFRLLCLCFSPMFLTLFSNPYVLNRECEANNVINSLNCDGFDIGSRCSLNLPDLR